MGLGRKESTFENDTSQEFTYDHQNTHLISFNILVPPYKCINNYCSSEFYLNSSQKLKIKHLLLILQINPLFLVYS